MVSGLLERGRINPAKVVEDPMHVRVDPDSRCALERLENTMGIRGERGRVGEQRAPRTGRERGKLNVQKSNCDTPRSRREQI